MIRVVPQTFDKTISQIINKLKQTLRKVNKQKTLDHVRTRLWDSFSILIEECTATQIKHFSSFYAKNPKRSCKLFKHKNRSAKASCMPVAEAHSQIPNIKAKYLLNCAENIYLDPNIADSFFIDFIFLGEFLVIF